MSRYPPRIVKNPLAVCGKNTSENKASRKAANSEHYVTDSNGPKYTTLWCFQLHHQFFLKQVWTGAPSFELKDLIDMWIKSIMFKLKYSFSFFLYHIPTNTMKMVNMSFKTDCDYRPKSVVYVIINMLQNQLNCGLFRHPHQSS